MLYYRQVQAMTPIYPVIRAADTEEAIQQVQFVPERATPDVFLNKHDASDALCGAAAQGQD